MYHYTESGLDNVYLKNGYRYHNTPYGRGVSIEDTEGLHKAIGKWLVCDPARLIGGELRFLRFEMEQTQRNLAAILGTTEQSLKLWEKNRTKPIPRTADHLLRALYLDYRRPGSVRHMLERLAQLDQAERVDGRFKETGSGWKAITEPLLECVCR
jgi:putative transcriptional regulator